MRLHDPDAGKTADTIAAGRPTTTVAVAMTPAADLRTVGPDTPIADAVRLLSAENIDQLPVMGRGGAVGPTRAGAAAH